MKKPSLPIFKWCFLLIITHYCSDLNCQEKGSSYYFFSNLSGKESDQHIDTFQSEIKEDDSQAIIISLGDNETAQLKKLNNACPECKCFYLMGEKDVDQKYEEAYQKEGISFKSWNKKDHCPEPVVHEIDDKHVMISINTNWFMDEHVQLLAKSENCHTFNENYFYESLESLLEDFHGDNIGVFLVMHHNITSFTKSGGKAIGQYNWLPVIGQFYISYIKNNGRKQDITSEHYSRFAEKMNNIISKYENVNVVSGHDRVSHFSTFGSNTSMNVFSGVDSYKYASDPYLKFVSRTPAFLKITFMEGEAVVKFSSRDTSFFIKNTSDDHIQNLKISSNEAVYSEEISDTILPASHHLIAGKFKRWFMGSGYRNEWEEKTKLVKTNIYAMHEGMKPYGLGGAGQTESLKLKAGNYKRYAFRLIEKKPEKSLSDLAKKTIYKDITNDLISTMHPYGPLVADALMNQTDILHVSPTLMAHQNKRSDPYGYAYFEHKAAYLEEKPRKKSKNNSGFKEANNVLKTYELITLLRKDQKNKLDQKAYAKARVMDMWLGDWDRHEDNWIWAQYDTADLSDFKPIPKDRDHVFSKWSGILPTLADKALPNLENFGPKFKDIRDLNFKARFLDRQLATELDKNDWIDAAHYLINIMSDSVISASVKTMPVEVYPHSGESIMKSLISRRDDLERAITSFYNELSWDVHIPGTNKNDFFDLTRNENGSVTLEMYALKKSGKLGEKYYSRVFNKDETKAIYCFGLGGDDRFSLDGNGSDAIKINIIGGVGKDSVYSTNGLYKFLNGIKIYDSTNEDVVEDKLEGNISRPKRTAIYDPYAFDYNLLMPQPGFRNSSGNGFGYNLRFSYFKRGFNKPEFAEKWNFGFIYYPEIKSYRFDGKYQYRHFISLSDLVVEGTFSPKNDKYPFYYGTGNNSKFDRDLRDMGFYRLDYQYSRLNIGLESKLLRKSTLNVSLYAEHHDVQPAQTESILPEIPLLNGIGTKYFTGFKSHLALDFTDDLYFPTDGNKLMINVEGRVDESKLISGKIFTEASYYRSFTIGLKTTLIGRVFYQVALGDVHFYHLSSIGSNTHFRGYPRNRFTDRSALVYNAEARIQNPTFNTPLVPISSGVFFFYDGGKVWAKVSDFNIEKWNNSYGFGFYLAPGIKQYTLTATFALSENETLYSKVHLGFDF